MKDMSLSEMNDKLESASDILFGVYGSVNEAFNKKELAWVDRIEKAGFAILDAVQAGKRISLHFSPETVKSKGDKIKAYLDKSGYAYGDFSKVDKDLRTKEKYQSLPIVGKKAKANRMKEAKDEEVAKFRSLLSGPDSKIMKKELGKDIKAQMKSYLKKFKGNGRAYDFKFSGPHVQDGKDGPIRVHFEGSVVLYRKG